MRNFFVYRLCSICKKYLWDFFGLQVLFHSWAIFVRNFFGCIPYVIKFCEKFFWKYFLAYKLCCMCEKYLWEFFFGLQVLFHSWEIFWLCSMREKILWEIFLAYRLCFVCEKNLWDFFFWLTSFVPFMRNFCEKYFLLSSMSIWFASTQFIVASYSVKFRSW